MREQLREATIVEIKEVARRQMAQQGTAALSLRSIAREMGLTAPAIYRYFPSRNDLITAIIQDGYHALADSLEQLESPGLTDTVLAYRTWALAHPIDYQLMMGNPIPDYEPPFDVLLPAYQRPYRVFLRLLMAALEEGRLIPPPEYTDLPPTIETYLTGFSHQQGYNAPPTALYLLMTVWTQIHGRIILEILNQSPMLIGDTEAFFLHETWNMLKNIGLK